MEKANTIVTKATAMKHAFEDLKKECVVKDANVGMGCVLSFHSLRR